MGVVVAHFAQSEPLARNGELVSGNGGEGVAAVAQLLDQGGLVEAQSADGLALGYNGCGRANKRYKHSDHKGQEGEFSFHKGKLCWGWCFLPQI